MKSNPTVLLVEDDSNIRTAVAHSLEKASFTVVQAATLREAKAALDRDLDLILLDLGLPDGDGLDLCRELRARDNGVAIIVVTARDAADQRVRGLELGADDYVVKPFHTPELIARMRTVLRRSGRSVGLGRVSIGEVWADPESRSAGRGDRVLELTPREFDLLIFLLRQPGKTWTRAQLLARVWGPNYDGGDRAVDLNIRRLRTHIEKDPSSPRYLETVWGMGYRMAETPPEDAA